MVALRSTIPAASFAAVTRDATSGGDRAPWIRRALTSLLDQGSTAGANFVVSVLLVRWLSPAEYGTFAVGMSLLYVIAGFHIALLVEPMNVLGPTRHAGRLPAYLGALVRVHLGFSAIAAAALACGGAVMHALGSPVGVALFGVAAALPFVLLQSLLRQACYLETRPNLALRGSVSSATILLGIILAMRFAGPRTMVSAPGAFGAMATASAVASAILFPALGVSLRAGSALDRSHPIRAEHWRYGRWFVAATIANAIGMGLYAPLVAGIVGLGPGGAHRALQNLFLPLQQTVTTLGMMMLPWLAARSARDGERATRRATRTLVSINVGLSLVYVPLVVLFGARLLDRAYGPGYHAAYGAQLPLLGLVSLVQAASYAFAISLRATEHPRAIFWSKALTAALLVGAGVPLIRFDGLRGAFVSALVCNLGEAAVLVWFGRQVGRAARKAPSSV